jgi:hypothetical protein
MHLRGCTICRMGVRCGFWVVQRAARVDDTLRWLDGYSARVTLAIEPLVARSVP